MTVECHECGAKKPKSKMYELKVYSRPFDDVSHLIYVCKEAPPKFKKHWHMEWLDSCEDLLTDSAWADFRYFTCIVCKRMICEQNPSNGWHIQYRYIEDEKICLQCYENNILETGHRVDEFDDGLPGMFLTDCELTNAGFSIHPQFDDVYIHSQKHVQLIKDAALELIANGKKVIIKYERMAIGGLEGYITLYSKG